MTATDLSDAADPTRQRYNDHPLCLLLLERMPRFRINTPVGPRMNMFDLANETGFKRFSCYPWFYHTGLSRRAIDALIRISAKDTSDGLPTLTEADLAPYVTIRRNRRRA